MRYEFHKYMVEWLPTVMPAKVGDGLIPKNAQNKWVIYYDIGETAEKSDLDDPLSMKRLMVQLSFGAETREQCAWMMDRAFKAIVGRENGIYINEMLPGALEVVERAYEGGSDIRRVSDNLFEADATYTFLLEES